jgi:hypothetical protein
MDLYQFVTIMSAIIILGALNALLLVYHQIERKKSIEREMKLIKAVLSQNVQELQMAEESPEESIKRTRLENDLAIRAEQLQQQAEKSNSDFDRIAI